jgi:nucleoside-diphosphate-sugar epimerase
MSSTTDKPSVLIVGGLGYVGRFLALHLHKNNLASEIRLVDKVLPQLAWLAPEFAEACSQEKFMQADASRERELAPAWFFCVASRPVEG